MNNKPVAWINREKDSGSILDWEKDPYSEVNIPLYTHPAEDLTDEEILKVAFKERIRTHDIEDDWGNVCIEFARAILRKAQGE